MPITADRDSGHRALKYLLEAVAPKQAEQTNQLALDISGHLSRCVEKTKAEACPASSIILDCVANAR